MRKIDRDMLLMWFKHYLPADLRGALMADLPQAYAAWMSEGRDGDGDGFGFGQAIAPAIVARVEKRLNGE